jgi:flagellar basal body-associated protein FliL
MDRMMDGMGGMMWSAGLIWLLLIVVLVLAAAAIVKYLRSNRSR